jgi:hypothetical protein
VGEAPRVHTQFDAQLLDAGAPAAPSIGRNHGRQVVALPDGTTLTALAFGGERPRLRLWQNRQLMADHPLEIEPAAPVLTAQGDLAIGHRERVAEAYGSHPVVLAIPGRVIIAFLGESCRLPSHQRWGDAWERLGRGGYIGALVREADAWRRFRLADSRQIVKPLRPIDTA